MNWLLFGIAAFLVLWSALELKTGRPDGTLVQPLHPYRRLMAYIMRTRNESLVYFDSYVDAENLLVYLEQARRRFEVDVTHCLVAAAMIGLRENPSMNRFVVGRRLYDRNGIFVTFSMKRRAFDRAAKLATVKIEMRPDETFADLCARMNAAIGVERSDARTYADREFALLDALPRPVLALGVRALKTLDYYNLLPAAFIANDPLYTSLFVANLGSLGMGAGYHHLYEWGTCPLFLMAGKIDHVAVADGSTARSRRMLHIRFTYDERIDDGLNARFGIESVRRVLANPARYFGCIRDDGSDAFPLGACAAADREVSEASAGAEAV